LSQRAEIEIVRHRVGQRGADLLQESQGCNIEDEIEEGNYGGVSGIEPQ